MYFYEKYSVTTTTKIENLEKILQNIECDLLYLDTEPDEQLISTIKKISKGNKKLPIVLTYVYQPRFSAPEKEIKDKISAIFYKPINLVEVSHKLDTLINI